MYNKLGNFGNPNYIPKGENSMKTKFRILAMLLAVLMAFSAFTMAGCSENGDTNTKNTEEPKKDSSPSTVQITNHNFSGLDWYNAIENGFKGDGRTANDKAFKEYVEYNDDKVLYFPKGVYCFEETLNFPDNMYVWMDPEAELKCIAKEPLEYFITLRGQHADVDNAWVGLLDYAIQSGIHGGKINCNNKAKCGLGLFQGLQSTFENFMILNVLEKGIQTLISKTTDGTYSFDHVYIYNSVCRKGSYGIYDNGYDNHFRMVTVVNFNTSFYTIGGRFEQVSGWNLDMSCVDSMTFAEVKGGQSLWIAPSVDTVRYGFKLHDGASTSISDMNWITNAVFYKSELQREYPRTIFWAENPKTARFMVNGLRIPSESNLSFANGELPLSSFMMIRYASDYNAPRMLRYFRDDTAALRELIGKK